MSSKTVTILVACGCLAAVLFVSFKSFVSINDGRQKMYCVNYLWEIDAVSANGLWSNTRRRTTPRLGKTCVLISKIHHIRAQTVAYTLSDELARCRHAPFQMTPHGLEPFIGKSMSTLPPMRVRMSSVR